MNLIVSKQRRRAWRRRLTHLGYCRLGAKNVVDYMIKENIQHFLLKPNNRLKQVLHALDIWPPM